MDRSVCWRSTPTPAVGAEALAVYEESFVGLDAERQDALLASVPYVWSGRGILGLTVQ